MKLSNVLEELNSNEKRQFLNLLEALAEKSQKRGALETLLDTSDADALKNAEGDVIAGVFSMLHEEYLDYVASEFETMANHTSIITDVLSRDGNSIMSGMWFDRLYTAEVNKLRASIQRREADFSQGGGDVSADRLRDYRIYYNCVQVAYLNDVKNNLDAKITSDESAILSTLASSLGLASQEVSEINHMVVPLVKHDMNEVLDYIRKAGLGFVQRKSGTVFVPDEMVRVFRKVHGRQVADKYFRRMLGLLKDSEVNQICKYHGLPMRGIETGVKIRSIIEAGISFTECFTEGIYKVEDSQNDRKRRLNEICEQGLSGMKLSGLTLTDKVMSIIEHFNDIDGDDHIDIGTTGYEGMLRDLGEQLPGLSGRIKEEFQFQEDDVMKADFLSNRGVKPRDVLELLAPNELKGFCAAFNISTRGLGVLNVLEYYKDSDNLLIEYYGLLAKRDLNGLRELGVALREAELGGKFEEVTKQLLMDLGLKVDDDLKKAINTTKDRADILVRGEGDEVILIECKSAKDVNFSKFSSLTRQMRSYRDMIEKSGHRVVKSLLVAPDFSDDFINAVELEYELNLTLIPAESLKLIHAAFKNREGRSAFPYKMLAHARDVVINPDRIINALNK